MSDDETDRPQVGELSLAQFCQLDFTLASPFLDGEEGGYYVRRNEARGLQIDTVTPKGKNGDYGKPAHYYYIDGDPNEYLTVEAWYEGFRARSNPITVAVWRKKLAERRT